MLRQVLPPLVTAYAIFVAMVVLARRRPVPRPRRTGKPPDRLPLRAVVRTTVGGYTAFLVIVLIFHVWLAEEPAAFASAVSGGAFLSAVALLTAVGSSLFGGPGRRSG